MLALIQDGQGFIFATYGRHGAMHPTTINHRLADLCRDLKISPARPRTLRKTVNSQLAKLDRFVARRRALAGRYDELLAPQAPLVRLVARNPDCRPAWHLYAVLIDFNATGIDRGRLMGLLREAGIGTQVHYITIHLQH